MTKIDSPQEICDYEGATYRTDFWEGRGRDYEDRVEREVLRRLLPAHGKRILEVGAGFGRLSEEWHGYEQVVLLDYSFSQLQYAREHLGDGRYTYVAANAYKLPFTPGTFDGATMIRVLHHMEDAPAVLRQVRRVLVNNGTFLLEYANKRNFKALLRHALRRQGWSPFTLEPVEFVRLNFDFHPTYIRQNLTAANFRQEQQIPVSWFRLGIIKDNLPTNLLASLDTVFQRTGLLYTPSIFTRNVATGESPDNLNSTSIFACPACGGALSREGDMLMCHAENLRWAVRDGIYDFKASV